jgi:MYXO-CTERM domain-containing protein
MVRGCISLAVFGAIAGAATPSQACSPPEDSGLYPQLVAGPVPELPTNGVLAFEAQAFGPLDVALALLSIEVTLDGAVVEGTIETVELSSSTDGTYESHRVLIVWRPAAELEASAQYAATVSTESHDNEGSPSDFALEVSTGAGPAGALPMLELTEPVLTAAQIEAGRRVCCEVENDGANCGFPECAGESLDDRPRLAFVLGAIEDPLIAQGYLRQRLGVDGETEPATSFVLAPGADPTSFSFLYEAAADSYCAGFELVSLIDGSVSTPVVLCADHGELELGSVANPGLDGVVDDCEAPYWEDTNEPYTPDGGESGDESSDGGESSDDGLGDEAGESEDGGNDGGNQDDDAKGCGCDVEQDGSLMPGLLALVLGLGLRRRRR